MALRLGESTCGIWMSAASVWYAEQTTDIDPAFLHWITIFFSTLAFSLSYVSLLCVAEKINSSITSYVHMITGLQRWIRNVGKRTVYRTVPCTHLKADICSVICRRTTLIRHSAASSYSVMNDKQCAANKRCHRRILHTLWPAHCHGIPLHSHIFSFYSPFCCAHTPSTLHCYWHGTHMSPHAAEGTHFRRPVLTSHIFV